MSDDLTPAEVREWLSDEEWQDYEWGMNNIDAVMESQRTMDRMKYLKSLAACRKEKEEIRAMLESREWEWDSALGYYKCFKCLNRKEVGHAPDCRLARLIRKETDDG